MSGNDFGKSYDIYIYWLCHDVTIAQNNLQKVAANLLSFKQIFEAKMRILKKLQTNQVDLQIFF